VLFGGLLLQPSPGLLDKSLIVTAVCTIADDRYDAILEIFLRRRRAVVGVADTCRAGVWGLRGNIDVEAPHSAGIIIITTQGAGQACERVEAGRTEYMTAIYCTWDANSGGRLSLELEVLEADIAGR
jgi:hypothetical protein